MFTCTVNKSATQSKLALATPGYTVSFCDRIEDVQSEWNLNADSNLFMQSSFLQALEIAPPSGTRYKYGIVRSDDKIVGIVYFQIKKINLYLSLRYDAYKPTSFGDRLWHGFRSILAKRLKADILVNGNMTLTGENGYCFSEKIDRALTTSLLDSICDELVCYLRSEKINIRAVLLKDYYTRSAFDKSDWSYTQFQVQPNMIMEIREGWKTFEDYLTDMKSKYRVRVRRARKKSQSLEKRILSLEEIHAYADDISSLYRNVADQAGFNLFILPKNYFYSLQKHLGDSMRVVAYFEEGKMTGYYTTIENHGDLDAHFLGYDPACNKNCQLYLNMLYDLVEDAIAIGANKLIMSRTAMEIKSSVGAEAYEMVLYMKATNGIINKGVARGLEFFTPKSNWQPRSPFK